MVGSREKAGAQHPCMALLRRVGRGGLGSTGLQPRGTVLPKLVHAGVLAGLEGREGGGAGANHGSWLEGLQVAGEEGRLQGPAGAARHHAAVGRELVRAARTKEDGLASSGLLGALQRPPKAMAELGPQHAGMGARSLEQVLGCWATRWGARAYRELVRDLRAGGLQAVIFTCSAL